MPDTPKRTFWPYIALLVVGALGAIGAYRVLTKETATYKIGLVTWIGYGPIYVADARHFFRDEHLSLEPVVMDQTGARGPAFINGDIDFYPDTPDSFVILFSTQKPRGKFVLALDDSEGADGIISKTSIKSVGDLRGKRIGFQTGITSHFLLLYLLQQHGLTASDITEQNLNAADAAQAFFAGHLDAAVTWEPWLTKASQKSDSHVLATSADTPGLITDVLLVSDRVFRSDNGAVEKFKRAWFTALRFMHEHPDEANAVIAKNLGITSEEVKAQLVRTKFYEDQTTSSTYLRDRFPEIATKCSQLYLANSVIRQAPTLSSMVDAGH